MKSSRIVIKNLPSNIEKNVIIDKFCSFGEITDIFIPEKNGKSRRMCFLGYNSVLEAEKAIKYWNGAYILNHKVVVEFSKEEIGLKRKVSESDHSRIKSKILTSKRVFVRGITVGEKELKKEINEKFESLNIADVEIFGLNRINQSKNAIISFETGDNAYDFYQTVKFIGGRKVQVDSARSESFKVPENYKYFDALFFNFEHILTKIKSNNQKSGRRIDLNSQVLLTETQLINETKQFLDIHNIYYKDKNKPEQDDKSLIIRTLQIDHILSRIKPSENSVVLKSPSGIITIIKFPVRSEARQFQKDVIRLMHKDEPFFYCDFVHFNSNTNDTCITDINITNNNTDDTLTNDNINKDLQTDDLNNNTSIVNDNNTVGNKLLIKNLPFQATESDVKTVFSNQFNVKKVIIPKKNGNDSRGFCFVTFNSSKDVNEAIKLFGISTHLYGRRLILEKAKK